MAHFIPRTLPPSQRRAELSRVRYSYIVRFITLATLSRLPSCREVAPDSGPNIPSARQNVEEFFYSVASRFTTI